MSGDDKQLELEALAAVGEMLLFDQARGNPEEAARILRCARLLLVQRMPRNSQRAMQRGGQ
jgi:hypothetical protein